MKKQIFTLLTLLLCVCSGAWAQTTIFDASAAGWSADGVDLTTGTTTVGDVTWYGRGSATIDNGATVASVTWAKRLKFGGKSTFRTGKTLAGVFTYTPSEDGIIKVYCTGGGDGDRTTYISQSITSTDRDASTAIGKYTSTGTGTKGVAIANVVKDQMVYIWADNNVGIYGITFTEAPVTTTTVAGDDITVNVSSAGYASLYYGEKLAIPAGVTAYSASVSGTSIVLNEVADVIPANTGVILKAAEGSYTFSVTTSDAPTVSSNILTGTTAKIAAPADAYTLGQNGDGVVGLRAYSGAYIRAYSAYATSITGARDFYGFSFGDETTALTLVNSEKSTINSEVFDLQGHKVANPTRGLYIVNGKKVIVK